MEGRKRTLHDKLKNESSHLSSTSACFLQMFTYSLLWQPMKGPEKQYQYPTDLYLKKLLGACSTELMFKLSLLEIEFGMSNLIWLLQLKVVQYLCFRGKPY